MIGRVARVSNSPVSGPPGAMTVVRHACACGPVVERRLIVTDVVRHPIVAAVSEVRSSLKSVSGVNPSFMSTADKGVALAELVRAEAQVAELRLRILADAGDVASESAAK